MALLMRVILKLHDDVLENYRDHRIDDWLLMNSIWQPLALIAVYLYIVLDIGPKLMENRKPFNIDKVLLVYNAFQIVVCAIMFVHATTNLVPYYNWRCQPVDYTDSYRGVLALRMTYLYFMLKILDLMDTVFFVLRKKNNQITFLHVYHHAGMVVLAWIGSRFLGGGVSMYVGYINTIVHMFMYSYYMLSVWNKEFGRNVWAKKQITHLQLLQFGLLSLSFIVIIVTEDCGFPKWTCMIMLPQNAFMFYLFGDFYFKAYVRKDQKKVEAGKND